VGAFKTTSHMLSAKDISTYTMQQTALQKFNSKVDKLVVKWRCNNGTESIADWF